MPAILQTKGTNPPHVPHIPSCPLLSAHMLHKRPTAVPCRPLPIPSGFAVAERKRSETFVSDPGRVPPGSDHKKIAGLLIVAQRHLDRVLCVYVEHYDQRRPQRTLRLEPLNPSSPGTIAEEHPIRVTEITGSAVSSTSTDELHASTDELHERIFAPHGLLLLRAPSRCMMWCMKRTNIYLGEAEAAALDQLAHAQGISRAELIRQLIDHGVGLPGAADLDADLAAIRDSFGVLRDERIPFVRAPDERARHLERVASQ